MAREIHDTLAQGLTGVVTQLEAANQSEGDTATRRRHLDNAARLARHSLTQARRSVQALGPGALEHGRLPDVLDQLVDDWSQLHGIRADAIVTGAPVPLPADVEVVLLRAAQEALANVAKHATAARVVVTLSPLGLGDRLVDQRALAAKSGSAGSPRAVLPRLDRITRQPWPIVVPDPDAMTASLQFVEYTTEG